MSGDYLYKLFVFRNKADGKVLVIAGDPQLGPVQQEGKLVADHKDEYELVEEKLLASPYWNGTFKGRNDIDRGVSLILPVIGLAIVLLLWAAFSRSRIRATILILPAVACAIYPLVALRHFVADTSMRQLSGIVLNPAIGAGTYVMLAGGILAAIGGLVVWLG